MAPESAVASTISNRVTPVRASPVRIAHGNRRAPSVARQQRRMHSEDAFARELDERIPHELRPADDEDELRLELPDGGKRLVRVDVARLVQHGAKASRDVVEGALAGAVRVDRAWQRDHAHDLGARSRRPPRGSRGRSCRSSPRPCASPRDATALLRRGRDGGCAAVAHEADPAVAREPDEERHRRRPRARRRRSCPRRERSRA